MFDFVDERLQVLDKALSDGMTSGPPNLMLLVDQFEEVFKPKVDPAGRSMLMSLITSIHNYKPFNLFLIITMRSEELHRADRIADAQHTSATACVTAHRDGGGLRTQDRHEADGVSIERPVRKRACLCGMRGGE